ncbi:MAG: hypothetical protein GXO98_08700 [Nitrospirae bacterium]|nr:hypothetical protein [Nitrospirota bacterium]
MREIKVPAERRREGKCNPDKECRDLDSKKTIFATTYYSRSYDIITKFATSYNFYLFLSILLYYREFLP